MKVVSEAVRRAVLSLLVATLVAVGGAGCRTKSAGAATEPPTSPPSAASPVREFVPEVFTARVVEVKDGDSLVVEREKDGRKVQVEVRLNGVDAPEGQMPFGPEAREIARRLALDKSVRVDARSLDRFGRTVAQVEVFGEDGQPFSLEMALVERGAAWWFERYAPERTDLKDAQERARRKRIGLWAAKSPQPPWEWRASNAAGSAPTSGAPASKAGR